MDIYILIMVIGVLCAAVSWVMVRTEYKDQIFRISALGPFAGRKYFTKWGWYLRLIGITLVIVGFALKYLYG